MINLDDLETIRKATATEIKKSFGQILDDVLNHYRYVVERHGTAKAIILSFDDFIKILDNADECQKISAILKQMKPHSGVGRAVTLNPGTKRSEKR